MAKTGKSKKKVSAYAEAWRRLRKNKVAMAAMVAVILLILMAALADVIVPYDKAITQSGALQLAKPSAEHWFGCDQMGRDLFARVVHGSRISLLLGFGTTLVTTIVAVALGTSAAYFGGKFDNILMRCFDILIAIPSVLLALAIWTVMAYAGRVKAQPERSLVAELRGEHLSHFGGSAPEGAKLNGRQRLALLFFAATFLVMVYAVIPFGEMGAALPELGWWFPELSALFLGAAILTGICCGLSEEETVNAFVSGAAELLGVAFIIGISRGITVVMNSGRITDTILSWGESALAGAGRLTFMALVYLIYLPLSFLIPSTSGLATLSMPIMAPLADFAGVSRSLVITAFQCACGLVNLVTPTSAVVMGALAIGHVPYDRWLKFIWKYLLCAFLLCLGLLCLGALAG